MAIDFVGNPIEIGDEVIITQLQYRNFKIDIVRKITDCFVILDSCKQKHNQVIVKKYILIRRR